MQQTSRPVRVAKEEGHENDQRGEIALLQRKTESIAVVQPGEEKAPDTLLLPSSKSRELGRKTFFFNFNIIILFIIVCVHRTKGYVFELKECRFRCDIRKKDHRMRVVRNLKRFPREVVNVPSLEMLKVRLKRAFSNLFLIMAEGLDWMI